MTDRSVKSCRETVHQLLMSMDSRIHNSRTTIRVKCDGMQLALIYYIKYGINRLTISIKLVLRLKISQNSEHSCGQSINLELKIHELNVI